MQRTISEIMTRDLLVVEQWENLHAVASDMERGHCRHLPVVDGVFGKGGRLVGILSHRDLLRFSASRLDPAGTRDALDHQIKAETFVGSVMTRDVTTVGPDTPIFEAVRSMLAARFGCLPVVDDEGLLVGVVSEIDLLKLLAGLLNLEEQALEGAEHSFHRSPSLAPTT